MRLRSNPYSLQRRLRRLGQAVIGGAGPIRGFIDIVGTRVRIGGVNGTSGSSATLEFVAANAVKMTLSANGCLGINDASPTYTLAVVDGGSGASYTFGAYIGGGFGRSGLLCAGDVFSAYFSGNVYASADVSALTFTDRA